MTLNQVSVELDPLVSERCWVWFVYGNDGWDVVCDYTINLESIIDPIIEYACNLS